MHGTYEANNAMYHCDLMINIGARFDDRITGKIDEFSPNSKKIHIDIDPSSINKIIKVDLDAVVHKSDYLIVKWDESVFRGGGTHGEVTMAYWLKKPIFLVNKLPIDDVSSWIFSCSEYIFENFEDLKKKLEELYY